MNGLQSRQIMLLGLIIFIVGIVLFTMTFTMRRQLAEQQINYPATITAQAITIATLEARLP